MSGQALTYVNIYADTASSRGKHTQLGVRILPWLLVLFLATACRAPAATERPALQSPGPDVREAKSGVAAAAKVASAIWHVVHRMQNEHVSTTARDTTAYSTPVVRVDASGRIQVDIVMAHVDDQTMSALHGLHVHIDSADARQHVIHGWIPFDRVQAVSSLPFVRYIRPPRYALRR